MITSYKQKANIAAVLLRDVGVPEGQRPVRRLGAIGRDVNWDDCHPAAEGPRQGRAAACTPCAPRVFRLATSRPAPEDFKREKERAP